MPRPVTTKTGFYFSHAKRALAFARTAKVSGRLARDRRTSIQHQPPQGRLLAQDQIGEGRQGAVQARAERSHTCFESPGQPPLGRADVCALAGEICKQAISNIDHDDAVADEVEAYRYAFAETTERPLRSSRP